jgi:L-2-hydroxyglutarate oxidase LhgO
MADIDAIVIGAGVVGLAITRALAISGRSVVALEAAEGIGTETSSRNSEVIHAGLYYPEGSLKARFCVAGRHRLYAYCAERGIPHRRCGKLIVACDEGELVGLEALADKGARNGVGDLERISAERARAMEPALSCVGALHSPSTGIIDSHAFMLALWGDARDRGAEIAFHAPFLRAEVGGAEIAVEVGGREPTRLTTSLLVNCAGLHASRVARSIAGLDVGSIPETLYAKGNYFALAGRSPFSRLIYPAPHAHGLGVHLTMDLGGQARFGPDVEWVESLDYRVNPRRSDNFAAAIRRYWPGLPDDALAPAYSGIRPKLGGPNDPAADFRVDVAGPVVNLYGIESPGLTSSLAIAEDVLTRLDGRRGNQI